MPRNRINYHEGDLIAVPLTDSGFAVGLIARFDKRGGILGYFFPTRWSGPPSLSEVQALERNQAFHIELFGDTGLRDEGWITIGQLVGFDRAEWPLPYFARIQDESTVWLVEYDEKKLLPVRETRIDVSQAYGLPRDGLCGSVALQKLLTKLISDQEREQASVM